MSSMLSAEYLRMVVSHLGHPHVGFHYFECALLPLSASVPKATSRNVLVFCPVSHFLLFTFHSSGLFVRESQKVSSWRRGWTNRADAKKWIYTHGNGLANKSGLMGSRPGWAQSCWGVLSKPLTQRTMQCYSYCWLFVNLSRSPSWVRDMDLSPLHSHFRCSKIKLDYNPDWSKSLGIRTRP